MKKATYSELRAMPFATYEVRNGSIVVRCGYSNAFEETWVGNSFQDDAIFIQEAEIVAI